MLCPRCEQGDVVAAQIRRTGAALFVCKECEATWFAVDDIGQAPFVDFGTYMEELGLQPLWDELIVSEPK